MLYDNVKAICKEKKITISRLETELGFPRSSISKWNNNEPSVGRVKKVADYLNVLVDDILRQVD